MGTGKAVPKRISVAKDSVKIRRGPKQEWIGPTWALPTRLKRITVERFLFFFVLNRTEPGPFTFGGKGEGTYTYLYVYIRALRYDRRISGGV